MKVPSIYQKSTVLDNTWEIAAVMKMVTIPSMNKSLAICLILNWIKYLILCHLYWPFECHNFCYMRFLAVRNKQRCCSKDFTQVPIFFFTEASKLAFIRQTVGCFHLWIWTLSFDTTSIAGTTKFWYFNCSLNFSTTKWKCIFYLINNDHESSGSLWFCVRYKLFLHLNLFFVTTFVSPWF